MKPWIGTDMLQSLLILKIYFTHESENKDLFCGGFPGSEISLVFNDNLSAWSLSLLKITFSMADDSVFLEECSMLPFLEREREIISV